MSTPTLTRRQRQAYADLLAGKHLWPAAPRGGGDHHPYSRRTLEALVEAGLAEWVVSTGGRFGVMPYVQLRPEPCPPQAAYRINQRVQTPDGPGTVGALYPDLPYYEGRCVQVELDSATPGPLYDQHTGEFLGNYDWGPEDVKRYADRDLSPLT